MCISEHTVKTIVQGMRKKNTPTCKNSLTPELNHLTYLERFQTTSSRDIRHAYTSWNVSTSITSADLANICKAAGFKIPKRMQKESAGFKNPQRLQPSHDEVSLKLD